MHNSNEALKNNFLNTEELLKQNEIKSGNRKKRGKLIWKIIDGFIVMVLFGLLLYTAVLGPLLFNEAPKEYISERNEECEIIDMEKSKGNVIVSYCVKEIDILYERVSYDVYIPTGEREFNIEKMSVFMGEITGIRNIRIDIEDSVFYNAVATVLVKKSYTETEEEGESVEILLGRAGYLEEPELDGSSIISEVVTKTTGLDIVFAPIRYDNDSSWSEKGNILYYTDICMYALPNGLEYSHIKTEDGDVYVDSALLMPSEKIYTRDELDENIRSVIETSDGTAEHGD